MNTTSPIPTADTEEPDLIDIVRKVWKLRKQLLVACGVGLLMGIVIGFSTPEEYTAGVMITPKITWRRNALDGMEGLTELMDEETPKNKDIDPDAFYPSLYPEIMASSPFLKNMFNVRVHTLKDTTTLSLYEYIEQHQQTAWWKAVTSLPAKLTGGMIALVLGKEEEDMSITNDSIRNEFSLTREEMAIAKSIFGRLSITTDKKKYTVTFSSTMQDPMVAAIVADSLREHMQQYIMGYRIRKALQHQNYTEKICQQTQADYYAAQKVHAAYADRNKALSGMGNRTELIKLRIRKEQAYKAYTQAVQQHHAALRRVANTTTPLYAIIRPTEVPLRPERPRKPLIVLASMLVCSFTTAGYKLFLQERMYRFMQQFR